jgi:hypothetical protein
MSELAEKVRLQEIEINNLKADVFALATELKLVYKELKGKPISFCPGFKPSFNGSYYCKNCEQHKREH